MAPDVQYPSADVRVPFYFKGWYNYYIVFESILRLLTQLTALSLKNTNAIARETSHATSGATFETMVFELSASVGPTGPQFKQHCAKRHAWRHAGRRAGNRVDVFHD